MEVCNTLPSKEEALWQKKKCLTRLSWSHLLSECWSALTCSWSAAQSWNSTLEWGLVGSKTQPKDKEARTGQQTDPWLCFFYATWLMQKWDLLTHSFLMRPTALQWRILFTYAFGRTIKKNGRKHILGWCWQIKRHSYTLVPLPSLLAAW